MTRRTVSAPAVLVDGELVGPAAVVTEGGVVVDVVDGRPPAAGDHERLDHGLLTPGLLDLQVNGGWGVDLVDADDDGWCRLVRMLPSTGVTAVQPTFVTSGMDRLEAALGRARAARDLLQGQGARIIGVHLEGPFLSPVRAGVHPVADLRTPTPELVSRLLRAGQDVLTMTTLAPELDGAVDAVRAFVAAGVVVSLGHSDATAEVMRAATDAGATGVTHLFNAQRGLGHREAGVAGAGLADDRLTLGLVADLEHVAAAVCGIVFRAAPGRVALVTDATAATGMPPGRYLLGGEEVVTVDDGPPRRADGTLAGSALTLDAAVRHLDGIGLHRATVLDAAARVPADLVGRSDLGRLRRGAAADLVWWDDDLRPLAAWVRGQECFRR